MCSHQLWEEWTEHQQHSGSIGAIAEGCQLTVSTTRFCWAELSGIMFIPKYSQKLVKSESFSWSLTFTDVSENESSLEN